MTMNSTMRRDEWEEYQRSRHDSVFTLKRTVPLSISAEQQSVCLYVA
jgi:hypothetical protein